MRKVLARGWRRSLAAPLVRLLVVGGGAFALAAALPRHASEPEPLLPRRAAASDEEILLRAGDALVATDDPVVRHRLAVLARYLDLGGTGEGSDELAARALSLGLGRGDVVVRRYLLEMTRLALERPAPADLPDEEAIAAYRAMHPERFSLPGHLRLTHVYLSRARRGDAVAPDAERLLAELRREHALPAAAVLRGDAFVRGASFAGSPAGLARALGGELAAAVAGAPLATWQGPYASPYGLHLVWVEARTPARPAPLEQVRGRVVHALLRERGEARGRERLAALRALDRAPRSAADARED